MNKKIIFLLVIAGLVALAIFLFWSGRVNLGEKIEARSFYGGLLSINPENPDAGEIVISVGGSFVSEERPDIAQTPHTLDVVINADTQITRTVIEWPTSEELEEAGWLVHGDDLRKETGPSSIRALVEDFQANPGAHINIFSDASGNIYGNKKFTAASLRYEVFPKPPILD